MLPWILLIITLILLGFLIIWEPLWLVPLLGVAVALEISSIWYPDLGLVERILGEITLTRLTSLALILAAFLQVVLKREKRNKLRTILRDPLTLVLLAYIALGCFSYFYSAAPQKTLAEIMRLLVLYAVFLAIALLLDRGTSLFPFHAIHGAALLLAPLSFYEALTGNLIWQGENLLKEQTLRVNATFVDPNIFARFLILGIVANLVIQAFTKERRLKLFYLISLAILLLQLVLTNSRGGIITLVAVLIVALFLLPNRKTVLGLLGLGAVGAGLILIIKPEILSRMLLLLQDMETASPQRLYLWKVALAIFKDHPLLGTGLGSFQTVFLTDYISFKNIPDGATLSHTTVLTIAAELGMVGLTVLAALWAVLLWKLLEIRKVSHSLGLYSDVKEQYHQAAGYLLLILTVFISSQGEGRFFEDPIFWLSCGVLVFLRMRQENYDYGE